MLRDYGARTTGHANDDAKNPTYRILLLYTNMV